MVFSSIPFIFYYLPLLLVCYYLIPARFRVVRNSILLVGSLFFYAWGEGEDILILLLSITVNHYIGRLISRSNSSINLIIGVLLNLFILGFYKYAGFLTELLGFTGWDVPRLPLGISFFTFQAISYLIDVSRKEAPPTNSIITTALYICSFPQLIAGPIVRYKEVASQLIERKESLSQFSLGIKIFIIGLSQKVLVANIVGETADNVFNTPVETLSTFEAWYGLSAYSLQIFFDFAGYSNMAIGLGHMFGFTFPKNFNTPYSSLTVTEFWRRWHMTLSGWFRDYLYIPLGGNRVSPFRGIVNLWIVFLLCGFWHGANWTFILWGCWHGFFLSIERVGLASFLSKAWLPVRNLYLVLVVFLGWVLFRADTVEYAIRYYQILFGFGSHADVSNFIIIKTQLIVFMVIAFCFSTNAISKLTAVLFDGFSVENKHDSELSLTKSVFGLLVIFTLFLLCIASISSNSYNPFIYFRF